MPVHMHRHEASSGRPIINILAIAGGLGLAASMLMGAINETRSFGSTHCTGMSQKHYPPGTPVDKVIDDLSVSFNVNNREYRAIFLKDNSGEADAFANDSTNNTLVIGNGTVNIADKCS